MSFATAAQAAFWRGGAAGARTPAPAFHRDNLVFRQEDGTIYSWAMGSEFAALRRKLDGVNLSAIYADRYAVGQRGFSFFVTSEIVGDELPGPYTDQQILDALGPLVDELRANGFNSEACVFQAVAVTMPEIDRQRRLWDAVLEIAATRPWMSVCWSKEWWKQRGAVVWDAFRAPTTGQTWDGGTTCDGTEFGPLLGTHYTYQPSRNDEWPRKTKSAFDVTTLFAKGCVSTEPMGAAERDEPGRRSNVAEDHFWSAANARLLSMGSYFHSSNGISCAPFEPRTRACAVATFDAMALIPLECQLGQYAKAIIDGPGTVTYDELRTYWVLLSADDQWAVVSRPGPGYPRNGDLIDPQTLSGWRITERHGPYGTVLRLTR